MTERVTYNDYIEHSSINWDFSGQRSLVNTREEVEYRNNSCMRIWFNNQLDSFDTHWHSAMEIIMPVENYYDVTIASTQYRVMPGEILFIPPGELHSLTAPESGTRFIFLFDLSPVTKLRSYSGIQSLLSTPLYVNKVTYAGIYDEVYQLLVQMRNEYFSNDEYAELSIYSLLLNLLTRFGYHRLKANTPFPNTRLYKQKEYVQKFNQLLDYIDAHYMEDLNLEELASSTGFSKYHFSRLFKQYTDFTFCDYICHRRLKVAEELLAQPDLSITEVALQSGFPSISTFNRLFKQQKQCTPSEYRAKHSKPRFLD